MESPGTTLITPGEAEELSLRAAEAGLTPAERRARELLMTSAPFAGSLTGALGIPGGLLGGEIAERTGAPRLPLEMAGFVAPSAPGLARAGARLLGRAAERGGPGIAATLEPFGLRAEAPVAAARRGVSAKNQAIAALKQARARQPEEWVSTVSARSKELSKRLVQARRLEK